jgi:CheY-like chemotaxis protein
MLNAKGHHLDVDIPRDPVSIDGDAARLTQMLSNLLGNSCKFTPPGGRIRLQARCAGADLTISVRDNGVGIPPELLAQVFDLFTQGDRSLERSTDGLGIGLSLVDRLAQMHGGSVEARSDGPGKGAEFIVHLPVIVSAVSPLPRQETHEKEETMTLRILVVDDSRDAAESLAMLLNLNGHSVDIANDGLVALKSAEESRPDLIFMDIGMPKLNGYDAARRIREAPWGTGITLVAISGWGQDSDREKSRAAGFDAHLVKPVEFSALDQILSQVAQRVQRASS